MHEMALTIDSRGGYWKLEPHTIRILGPNYLTKNKTDEITQPHLQHFFSF